MRAPMYVPDDQLCEADLEELTDLLACQIYKQFGSAAYSLARREVSDVLVPYIHDLCDHDRKLIPWLVWDLLQEGMDLEFR